MSYYFIFVEARAVEQESTAHVRALGFSPILFTCLRETNPDYYHNIDQTKFDKVFNVDTHDSDKMHELIVSLDAEAIGIMACYDDVVIPAAIVAEKLFLQHPNVEGLRNAFFKDDVRNILARAGIKQPQFTTVDLEAIPPQAPINFPFVIKPVRDSGAFGVFLCQTPDDYSTAIKELTTSRRTRTGLLRTRVLLEEFIGGDFYGAELLWNKGQWVILGINKIFVDPRKSLCMTGISHPSDISDDRLRAVEDEILKWVGILKLEGGALNVEFKLVENVPVLIEVNLRLAGAKVNKQLQLCSGISPIEYIINQACGREKDLDFSKKPRMYVADAFIFPQAMGEISGVDIQGIDKTNLLELSFRKFPFVVSRSENDFSSIIGHVLAAGADCQRAMQNATTIIQQIKLITPSPEHQRGQRDTADEVRGASASAAL